MSKPTISRRRVLKQAGSGLAAGALAVTAGDVAFAQDATPVASPPSVASTALPPEVLAIIGDPTYFQSRWGIYLADRDTGEVLQEMRSEERFLGASTTKLWAGAAALDAYGPDYRFETPIYRTAEVSSSGELTGDLILVASGDMTMGGRDTPEGGIAYTEIDHIYANALSMGQLTPEDPLAGIDDLAEQVAKSGIKQVSGDIIIDARLFPQMPKDDYILTPIWINDNLIDLTFTPGAVGETASLAWRPQTAYYTVKNDVKTVAAGQPRTISITSPGPNQILLSGDLPADSDPFLQTFQVEDPQAFARAVLIEALERKGVHVTAPNAVDKLPAPGSYQEADRVALHTSLPFSENIKLIFKVSHNQHADMLIFLLALKHGETTFDAGMTYIRPIVVKAGIEPDRVSLKDGRGNEYTDLFSPETVCQLLRYMATRPDSPAYHDALPILGVDGSETNTVKADSPVAGKAYAKSGTTVDADLVNQKALLMTRALAGYLTTKSGRELVVSVVVVDAPLDSLAKLFEIIPQQGAIFEIFYEMY